MKTKQIKYENTDFNKSTTQWIKHENNLIYLILQIDSKFIVADLMLLLNNSHVSVHM